MNNRKTVSICIRPELLEALTEEAYKQRITRSRLIEKLLEDACDQKPKTKTSKRKQPPQ